MKTVTLLRDFAEDKRISMERYADHLLGSLHALRQDRCAFRQYQPQLGSTTRRLPQLANIQMRYARYVDYPRQVKTIGSQVFHIQDHGYAHLIKWLDAERVVVTAHDIIPLLAGRGLIPGVKQRRNWLAEYSFSWLKKAAKIISVSENTKSDLVQHCGCEPKRIDVIYSGIADNLRPVQEPLAMIRKLMGLPPDKKLVLITGAEPYKNHTTSLKVVKLLQEKYGENLALVRLGQDGPGWQQALAKSRFSAPVLSLTRLTSGQLVYLYNAVDCLLFPSWYEGFGWPPLEAMACGTPVVTSNRSSLPEIVGNAGPVFAPEDVEGMAKAVEKLLFSREYRRAQVDRGIRQAGAFSWPGAAAKVAKVYEELY
jgi:glycosyltransferase involved in cell wall biosynthesis